MHIYRDADLQTDKLTGARVAVVGYGNQGHAHAMNLRDSGIDVVVGAREGGGGWRRAVEDHFDPVPIADAVASADVVAILLPDEVQGRVFADEIRSNLKPGSALVFAHGFGITFGAVNPPAECDVLLVAPKGQGDYLRKMYREGNGLPCLIAVETDRSGSGLERALSYARALGCLRAGAIETTFREEAITDLFGEQTVLCGGVPALVKAAFETLVSRGYSPEVAYLECLHELKIITDLMHKGGVAAMRRKISGTAAWGSFVTERSIVSDEVKSRMAAVLDEIESGGFADGWYEEASSGQRRLSEHIEQESSHPIEAAGRTIRELMPYLKEDDS